MVLNSAGSLSSLLVCDDAFDADETAAHDDGNKQHGAQDAVTHDELPKAKHEHSFVAIVARFVKRRLEVRLPYCEQPVVAENKPAKKY